MSAASDDEISLPCTACISQMTTGSSCDETVAVGGGDGARVGEMLKVGLERRETGDARRRRR